MAREHYSACATAGGCGPNYTYDAYTASITNFNVATRGLGRIPVSKIEAPALFVNPV